jgi:hypothetical protein
MVIAALMRLSSSWSRRSHSLKSDGVFWNLFAAALPESAAIAEPEAYSLRSFAFAGAVVASSTVARATVAPITLGCLDLIRETWTWSALRHPRACNASDFVAAMAHVGTSLEVQPQTAAAIVSTIATTCKRIVTPPVSAADSAAPRHEVQLQTGLMASTYSRKYKDGSILRVYVASGQRIKERAVGRTRAGASGTPRTDHRATGNFGASDA